MKPATRIAAPLAATFGLVALVTTVVFAAAPTAPPSTDRQTEANITRLTTSLLERSQFAHHPLDSELAGTLLDRYYDALDPTRSLLMQSDLDELASYRATLALATRTAGDTTAAHAVFSRYLQRLEQRAAFVTETLRAAQFDFAGRDVYSFDREHAKRPRDLAAAHELWRQQLRSEYLQSKLGDKRPEQITAALTRRYAQQLRTMKDFRSDEVLESYLNTLAHVYDPHSDYLGHEEMENLSIAMNLSLFGIGAALESDDGVCKIRELIPGGPAARSGLLKPGDRIVAVAQAGKEPVDIGNMPLSRSVELIRGPRGTTVTLSVLPVGAPDAAPPKTIALVRAEITLEDQQAKARIMDLPTGKGAPLRVGVIDLPSFYADMGPREGGGRRSATADVARLLTKLKAERVRGIVLDLRRNGGGSLEEAISLTGLFIRKGPVVQTRGLAGEVEVDADKDASVLYDGPLVLLTSRFSASATEILAGALQDYGRAVIAGDSSTFGKGTVQNVVPLARIMDQMSLAHAYDPGALKVTIRKFYRPGGASTQLRGVASDIVLPSTSDFSDVSESALTDPLPWDAVPAAPFDRLNRVQPYVAALRDKSAKRVAAAEDFVCLAEDIARLRKNLATKTVSMNEAERRQEMVQAKAHQEACDRKSRTLHANHPVIYEITLKNASSPGLPPPMVIKNTVAGKSPHGAAASSPSPSPTTPGSTTPGSTTPGSKTPGSPTPGSTSAPAPAADRDDADSSPATGRSPADDVILNEGVQILSDYVGLLPPPTGRNTLAGP